MKNKKLLLMLVILAILVVGSITVGGANPFSTLKSRVGGIKSLFYIGINALIIGAVLYFGLSFFKSIVPQNRSGQVVFLIVVVIFAIMFAAHIHNMIGNEFIWSSDAFKAGRNYLFAKEYKDKDKSTVYGILHPAHIWKFIGFTLIITWLFITFLKIGQSKQMVDITLAVILSASAVHSGISLSNVIRLGQVVSLLILTVQFSKTLNMPGGTKVNWIGGFIMALILVWLISYLVFGTGLIFYSGIGVGEDKKDVQISVIPKGTVESKDLKTGVTEPVSKMWVIVVTLIILFIAIAVAYFMP